MAAASVTYAFTDPSLRVHHTQTLVLDQIPEQSPTATLASLHSHIFVREDHRTRSVCAIHTHTSLSLSRDYADFTIPPPFSSRVRNALNAEAKSVKLSALVGAGGLWYGYGKIIMRLSVPHSRLLHAFRELTEHSRSLDDVPANEMSELLTKARFCLSGVFFRHSRVPC